MNRRSFVTTLAASSAAIAVPKPGFGATSGRNVLGPIPFSMEYMFSYTLSVQPEVIGPVAEGIRVNLQSRGGTLNGPDIKGKIRPEGADYLYVRSDGIASLDVRLTFETTDGALIYSTYTGVGELGLDGFQRFATGNVGGIIPLRVAPRYSTAHPGYIYLNRLQCVGIGGGDLSTETINFDIYAIR
ncbi:MAG TPA: DUF3237 domain-containing protein [Bryobacteraceae bacterium]|jgi:uncharacterized protein DUF3237|nr:DUF3237 domain-containing protein [Bryobacteraceae bacterium]